MIDYNDGKWHGWNGGKCPVDPQAEVRIWDANSHQDITLPAECVHWTFSGTFRVVTPAPPKPREWWRSESDGQTYLCDPHDNAVVMDGFVRVREVLE